MAIKMLDLAAGSDNNSGDSWTVDLTNIDGVVTGNTTLTSAIGGFTAGMVGRYISLSTVTPYSMNIIASYVSANVVTLTVPVANATYTYIVGGPWLTINTGVTAARGVVAGDTIRIAKTADPVSIGSATWTDGSSTVTLASGTTTATIDMCESAWTAAPFVTTGTSAAFYKEGASSSLLTVTGTFTTGLIAYNRISSTDYSSYQKISFWILTSADVAANTLRLDLCSDTAGATPVNSATINFILRANRWNAITVNTGGALGSAIQSVALTALLDPGVVGIYLDNIIACNDLDLMSLISKNSGNEHWWAVKSINGATVILGESQMNTITNTKYYSNTSSESVTTYTRSSPIAFLAASINSSIHVLIAGSTGNQITYSGGWNTSSGLQDGYTYLTGRSGWGVMIAAAGYTTIDHLIITRCNSASTSANIDSLITSYCYLLSCATYGLSATSNPRNFSHSNLYICQVGSVGINHEGYNHTFTNCFVFSSTTNNITMNNSFNNIFTGIDLRGSPIGIGFTQTNALTYITNSRFSNHTTGDISASGGAGFISKLVANNTSFLSSTIYANNLSVLSPCEMKSFDHNGVAGSYFRFHAAGSEKTDTVIYKNTSPSSRVTPRLTTVKMPSTTKVMVIRLGESLPNVTVWVRKSISTDAGGVNYGINQPRLIVRNKPEIGIASDTVLATVSVSNGVWQQLTGVVPVPTDYTALQDMELEFFIDCDRNGDGGGTPSWINISDFFTNQGAGRTSYASVG